MIGIGIDCGSSSVKLAVIKNDGPCFRAYKKIFGNTMSVLERLLSELAGQLPESESAPVVLTGVGAQALADAIDRNVKVLNDIPAIHQGVKYLCPTAVSVMEIGSRNAVYITDMGDGMTPQFSANEHCAGGTGSFFENQMARLEMNIEDYSKIVQKATKIPRLSGRCAVFAKTDIIHRQQEGEKIEDILLGLCYAMVKNYKGVIVGKLPVSKPVVLCGGVAQNKGVVRAVKDVFDLEDGELLIPEDFLYVPAFGAALEAVQADKNRNEEQYGAGIELISKQSPILRAGDLLTVLRQRRTGENMGNRMPRLAVSPVSDDVHMTDPVCTASIIDGEAVLGIDIGSTSTNLVVVNRRGELVDYQYLRTLGDAGNAVKEGLRSIRERFGDLKFITAGVTGSGRERIAKQLGADTVVDEITAQARAACQFLPEADNVFEIGGQDSKFIALKDGAVSEFRMNKICSAGTGTLAEEQALSLGVSIGEFGEQALLSDAPVDLGDRCTVFIDSAVSQAVANNVPLKDIAAGVCEAIVRNYLYKVANQSLIGEQIVLQGGVAYNPGIVAAFMRRFPGKIKVNPYFSVSGAYGVALIAAERMRERQNKTERAGLSDNRAYRDFYEQSKKAFYENYDPELKKNRPTVGIPLVLVLHKLFPMVNGYFRALGFNVVLSQPTNEKTVALCQQYAQGEVCFPVKLIYGHMRELIGRKVDYIFMPAIRTMKHKCSGVEHNYGCVYMQTAGRMVAENLEIEKYGIKLLNPVFDLDFGAPAMAACMVKLGESLGFSKPRCMAALMQGSGALKQYTGKMALLGRELLTSLRPREKILVLITRPYNIGDAALNMGIADTLLSRGYKVITLEHLPAEETDISAQYPNLYWPFAQHIVTGAKQIRRHPNLYAVYLTNHGCGPDTMLQHIFRKEMGEKPYLQIEIDEHFSPIGIITRIDAFLNELEQHPNAPMPQNFDIRNVPVPPYVHRKQPERGRRLYIPYLSAYSETAAEYLRKACGADTRQMKKPDMAQFALGSSVTSSKEYVPFTALLGGILALAKEDDGEFDVWIPENQGADADGVYGRVIASVLEEKGLGGRIRIVSPMLETLPREDNNVLELFRAILKADIQLTEKQRTDAPRVMMVGSPFCMHTLSDEAISHIREKGAEVCFAPMAEYLYFLWSDHADKKTQGLLGKMRKLMEEAATQLGEKSTFAGNPEELREIADARFAGFAGANGRYRYAKAVHVRDCAAVLAVAPRYENTSFVLELSGMDGNAPIYHLAVGQTFDDSMRTKLDAFLYYIRKPRLGLKSD